MRSHTPKPPRLSGSKGPRYRTTGELACSGDGITLRWVRFELKSREQTTVSCQKFRNPEPSTALARQLRDAKWKPNATSKAYLVRIPSHKKSPNTNPQTRFPPAFTVNRKISPKSASRLASAGRGRWRGGSRLNERRRGRWPVRVGRRAGVRRLRRKNLRRWSGRRGSR